MFTWTWRNWDPPALLVGVEDGAAPVKGDRIVPQKVTSNCHLTQQFHFCVYAENKVVLEVFVYLCS